MNLPDQRVRFFFVGVGKCGTSWIYEYLRRNRLIGTPAVKEPYLVDLAPKERDEMIRKIYPDDPELICADFSNLYYWDDQNPLKLKALWPDATIIVTVRKPSDRIVSHFEFMKRSGLAKPNDSLGDYLDDGDELSLVDRSRYEEIVGRYVAAFGRDRVHVLPLEMLREAPQAYADRLHAILGLTPRDLTDEDRGKVLAAARARSTVAAKVAMTGASWFRKLGWLRALGALKRSSLIQKMLFVETAAPVSRDFGGQSAEVARLDRGYRAFLASYGNTLATDATPD